MKKLTRLSLVSALVISALTLMGVFTTAAQDESVLVVGFEQEPPNLWPLNTLTFGGVLESFYSRDLWDWDVDRNIYPLMVDEIPSVENGGISVNDEGNTVVTITLSEGLEWSDGTPITAADCEIWHTIRTDRSTSTNVSRNAYPDLALDFAIDEANPLSFSITYAGTFADVLVAPEKPECRYPAHVFGPMIADGGVLEDSPYFVGGMDFDGLKTVSYGPYSISEWNIGENVILVKNPTWDGPAPAWDRIVVPFITDSAQMRNALTVGEIDVTFNWSDDQQADYAAIDGVETVAIPGVYSDALWIRMGENGVSDEHGGTALLDPTVRQAIAHAVDRTTLAEELVGPGVLVPTSWYPQFLWPEELPYLEYDPELAASMLDEAGWTLNADGIREKDGVTLDNLRFVTTENELRNNYQLFIQEYLAEIGIGVDIQIIPATVLFATFGDGGTLTNYEWDLAIFANSANALSPTSYDDYKCAGIPSAENPDGFNPWQFCDDRYDELDALIATTLPGPERDALVAEAVTLHWEGFFWHGLRLRATWFAVDGTVVSPQSVADYTGSLSANWFNQIEYWVPAS